MSGDGSEVAPNFHVIPQSYGGNMSPAAQGFLQPPQQCNSQDYTAPVPYVSSQLNSLAATHHLNSIYTDPARQMMMHTNPHFMEHIHTNQPLSLPQTIGQQQSIKQEPGFIPGGTTFIKQEPGLVSPAFQEAHVNTGGPHFISREPIHGGPSFTNQEPRVISDGLPFIKQEPGLERRTLLQNSGEAFPGGYSRNGVFVKPEHAAVCKPEPDGDTCYYRSVKQEVPRTEIELGAAFPSQPLDFNFMADIEDIVPSEVSIDSIQKELSSFEGSSDLPRNHVKVREVEEEGWEPPVWKQQYENIRTMRAKRDAPVDKYGCFMNAERDVPPEVRRYQLLVSLMLSSQTKDEVVGKAMTKLKENGLTIRNVINTPQEEIARMIFPVGFWNKKSEYIKKTTVILEEKFSNDIPNSVEGLVSLPGIGPKMAHLIMDFAWGEVSGIAVDTHVHRITHRLGWMRKEARNPEEARKRLEKWFPRSEWSDLNLLCVGFGQQICSPVGPKCSDCLNKDLCPSSSCLVSSGLHLGTGFEVSTKSKGKKAKSNSASAVKTKKIKIEK